MESPDALHPGVNAGHKTKVDTLLERRNEITKMDTCLYNSSNLFYIMILPYAV